MLRIVFTESTGIVAWCIRKFTGGKASHVGLQIDNNLYLHADQGGVKLDDLDGFLRGTRKILAVFEASPEIENNFNKEKALNSIGKAYDYDALIGFLPVIFLKKWFKIKIDNPLSDKDQYICSEYVSSEDFWGIKPIEMRLGSEETTPTYLLNKLRRSITGNFKKL